MGDPLKYRKNVKKYAMADYQHNGNLFQNQQSISSRASSAERTPPVRKH
jgi:hypothetical protein